MYDFHCPSCGHRFEAIQPSGNPNPPCPACSRPTQRQPPAQ
ncbi:MAG: zinc ribbon domain-containing protein [Gammaproteobacteria bacterium]